MSKPSMRFSSSLAALAAALAAGVAATDVMVPLYVYPGNTTWTNPNWEAAVAAIRDHPDTHFYVVINPNNGPMNTSDPSGFNGGFCNVDNQDFIPHGCNRDWTTHMATISQLPNAQTVGYVYTGYGDRPADKIKADILEWSLWDKEPTWNDGEVADISIHGLWFDEIGSASNHSSLYLDLVTYANKTFRARDGEGKHRYTVVLNAGRVPDRDYEAKLFNMASAVVTKETCFTTDAAADGVAWDCPEPYAPFNVSALGAGDGLPHDRGLLPRSVVIVHQFRGPTNASLQMLTEQIGGLVRLGVHSTYFTSGSWHNTTIMPATIGNVAQLITTANASGAAGARGHARLPEAWRLMVCALLTLGWFHVRLAF